MNQAPRIKNFSLAGLAERCEDTVWEGLYLVVMVDTSKSRIVRRNTLFLPILNVNEHFILVYQPLSIPSNSLITKQAHVYMFIL